MAKKQVRKKAVKKAVKKTKPKKAVKKSASSPKSKSSKNAAAKKSRKAIKSGVTLPPDYEPSDKEEFMNPIMLQYFEQKLKTWRADLLTASNSTLVQLQEGNEFEPDIADRATTETNRSLELRTRDRARKLIAKIDSALERIANGNYGYCDETGEPISLFRLEARPIATLSIEAQERHERMEKTHRDN
jgi:DnaK suppressor protein